MPRIVPILLPVLGMRRGTPSTPMGRALRKAERAAMVLALGYGLLHAYPRPIFAHVARAGDIAVYSRSPLGPSAPARLAEIADRVARSELASPGRAERIFVCDSRWLYRAFAPLSPGSFAVSIPLTGNIFVASADLDRDASTSEAAEHNRRPFTAVAAHEVAHNQVRRRLGVWRSFRLPDWLAEGYCEVVAGPGGGSFPEAEGRRRFLAGQGRDALDGSYRYFVYRLMVAHLIEGRHLTFDQIARNPPDPDAVEAEAREALRASEEAR